MKVSPYNNSPGGPFGPFGPGFVGPKTIQELKVWVYDWIIKIPKKININDRTINQCHNTTACWTSGNLRSYCNTQRHGFEKVIIEWLI